MAFGDHLVKSEVFHLQQLLDDFPRSEFTSICEKHEGEVRKPYCFECKQLICRDCILVDHAGHRYDFVKSVTDAFREEVLSSLVPLRDTRASVTTAIVRVKSSKEIVSDQGANIATTITRLFDELCTILNKHKQVLLQQAQEIVGRKVGTLERQQDDLQLALGTLDSLVGFIERTAENANDEEFISMKQQMICRVKQVSKKYKDMKFSVNEVANTFVAIPPPSSFTELCKSSFVGEVEGPGLKFATIQQVSKFKVCTHYTHGQPPPVQQQVSAKLESLVDGSVLQATVVSQTPSVYELSYTPTIRGRHRLTVQVNNTEIGMFQVFVQHPPTQLGTPVRVIEGVEPWYIAVGDKGELFVTELRDHQYTILDAEGIRVLTIGSKGKPPFGDRFPTGIAVDGEGNLYIASYPSEKIFKFNRHGEVIKSVGKSGKGPGEFDYPCAVRYHNHQVYVCDCNNGRVQVFDSNLNFVQSFGTDGDGPGTLKEPRDIDFDTQGNIYVVDFSKAQVVVFSENGQYLRHIYQCGPSKGELSEPKGLCVSGDYVYVTDFGHFCVSVFYTSGEFVHFLGNSESGGGELNGPYGIAIDQDGFLFVCDRISNCIQVF